MILIFLLIKTFASCYPNQIEIAIEIAIEISTEELNQHTINICECEAFNLKSSNFTMLFTCSAQQVVH